MYAAADCLCVESTANTWTLKHQPSDNCMLVQYLTFLTVVNFNVKQINVVDSLGTVFP